MDSLKQFFDVVGGWVWGVPMLTLLVGTGVYLSLRLRFLQFSMLVFALKQAFTPHGKKEDGSDHDGDVSHFGALMTALSATIGTGNIAGVATAVVAGGPGAVFWMWVTAIFGMATKYAEGVLAVKYRTTNSRGEKSGGPMYYIERGLNMKWMALLFALFGTLASFGIGSSVQSNSVAQSIQASFQIDSWMTGVVLTVFTALVILGGIKSISRVSSAIVPVMAIGYVLGGLVVIFSNLSLVGPVLELIFTDAFTGQAVAGGALGTVIRYGVARGVFSNEAGMGSAPIAAAAAKTDHPVRQGLVSMTGTFLDTIVVCSITGIVLVMGGHGFDALGGIDDDGSGFHSLKRRQDLAGKIGQAGGVDHVDAGVAALHVHQCGLQRMLGLDFQRIVIADGAATLHRACRGNGASLLQQGLCQRGLAAACRAGQRQGSDVLRGDGKCGTGKCRHSALLLLKAA